MRVVATTTPDLPLSFEQMQSHLRIDADAEESYVMDLVASAVAYAESQMAMSLMPRTIQATFEQGEPLILPNGPVIEVIEVEGGNDTPIAHQVRYVDGGTTVALSGTPAYPVKVTYEAGYQQVPADILAIIRAHVGTMYNARETHSDKAAQDLYKLDEFYRYRGNRAPVT